MPFKRKYQIGNCFLRYVWTVDINLSSRRLVNEKANENFITKKQNNQNEKITGEGYTTELRSQNKNQEQFSGNFGSFQKSFSINGMTETIELLPNKKLAAT